MTHTCASWTHSSHWLQESLRTDRTLFSICSDGGFNIVFNIWHLRIMVKFCICLNDVNDKQTFWGRHEPVPGLFEQCWQLKIKNARKSGIKI